MRKASPIVVDSRPTVLRECGDLLPALEKGRFHMGSMAELGEVIAGTRRGRTSPEQVTLFESRGMAIQNLGIAERLARMAHAQGQGADIDLGA